MELNFILSDFYEMELSISIIILCFASMFSGAFEIPSNENINDELFEEIDRAIRNGD